MSENIKELTRNLANILDSNSIYLNDQIATELDLFLSHFINDHRISEYNLNRLIDGFIPSYTQYHSNVNQNCEYFSILSIPSKCVLTKNYGKNNKWNKDDGNMRKDVFKTFSSSIGHFLNGFNDFMTDNQNDENTDLMTIESNCIVLINQKRNLKTLVSSKQLSIEEIEDYSKTYDLIIHGISRILDPQEFTENLIKLALMGIGEIYIPDNKESETRLFRDFDKEATSNLMLLTALIDVRIGNTLIKSEQQVLQYCAIASKTTSSSQMADIRKIQAEWINEQLNVEKKSLVATMGHFKGSFNKIMTRAILVERSRNNDELLKFFKDNIQSKIALVDDKLIIECIKTSMKRAFLRLSEKVDTNITTLQKFFVFDQETLVEGIKKLMIEVPTNEDELCRITECLISVHDDFDLCKAHLKEAQLNY